MERAYYYVENYEPEPEATDDTVVYEAKPDVEFVITRGTMLHSILQVNVLNV